MVKLRHLAHDGDDGDLWLLASGDETAVKGFQRQVEPEGRKSRPGRSR
jgi:hypothetical protein